jgi:hypothetical protein
MKKRNWGYLLLILILAVFFYPVSYLEVRGKKGSQHLLLRKVSPGDRFEFRYIHSVDKTPVSGVFLITPRRTLKPVETRFLSYGPGLPSTEGKMPPGGGEIVAKTEAEEIKQFSFFVSPPTRPSLILEGGRLDFSSFEEGDVITIEVRQYPMGGRLIRYGRQGN